MTKNKIVLIAVGVLVCVAAYFTGAQTDIGELLKAAFDPAALSVLIDSIANGAAQVPVADTAAIPVQ